MLESGQVSRFYGVIRDMLPIFNRNVSVDSFPDLDKILYQSMFVDSSPELDKISTCGPIFRKNGYVKS